MNNKERLLLLIVPMVIAAILIFQNANLNRKTIAQAKEIDTMKTMMMYSYEVTKKRVSLYDSLRHANNRRDSLILLGLKNLGAFE